MVISDIIKAYNEYIHKRRKELRLSSSTDLVAVRKVIRVFHSMHQVTVDIIYNHSDNRKVLLSHTCACNIPQDSDDSYMEEVTAEILPLWIDFFSENEDRIIDGRVWK